MELLFFSSPTCGKCKTVYEWWNSFVADNTWLDFKIIDTSLSLDAARKYEIRSLPSFVLRDGDGVYLAHISDTPARGAVERMVEKFRGSI
jgi:hypothetical protein